MNKTYRIVIQPEAQEGMENAYRWIEEQSPEAAERWMTGLMSAIQTLSTFPTRCSLAPENNSFEEEIRHLLYGRRGGVYRILFTIEDDVVSVLYVRHSAQHWIVPEN